MSEFEASRKAALARALEGDGRASRDQRRAAFDAPTGLWNKVAQHAYRVTDEDIAAAKASGLTEDQIFELVICAAYGQATRQYETALAALSAAERS